MPEGDSVYQLAKRLHFLTGRQVTHTSLRVPRYATTSFTGSTCTEVWPLGKHLFMAFGEHILHTHLKMEGTWAIHPAGTRWRKPGHTARVVLRVTGEPDYPSDIEIVGHSLGLVDVFPTAEYREKMGYLGPDLLKTAWLNGGREEAIRRLALRPERSIGAALLDQKNLAGIGNEYRAEICFLAGVHPTAAVGTVNLPQIVDLARRLMWANKDSPNRVTTGIRGAGESSYVFGRYSKPCRRCGTLIEKAMLGGVDAGGDEGELERVIWFCPRCQPSPETPR
ncbi:DNA-formamidopyrimidine glycosylase family protein [Corynebacterium choanae]|uniref:DNA-(apurinic or apyrimidinic site) lyase n=1 Tax=Corynebacterium choanae TaxID=1862358 RepID=A0A3G6J4P8_9CORY|nr:DNA-formamidopyrimidine glycosylase family protein [Corynebacterium choanae]AZA13055.1 Endonuclease 8 1 [Corynebacterium choanae]